MNIRKTQEGGRLIIALDGRLDTGTAPQLESEFRASVNGVTDLVFDLTGLSYISSAGLRVLLSAQKIMNKQGHMVVRGANEDIMDIFEVTGFVDILNIEQA